MTVQDWYAWACADAERRGMPALKPLLQALADWTQALRSADWDAAERPSSADPAAPSGGRAPEGPAAEGDSGATGPTDGARS